MNEYWIQRVVKMDYKQKEMSAKWEGRHYCNIGWWRLKGIDDAKTRGEIIPEKERNWYVSQICTKRCEGEMRWEGDLLKGCIIAILGDWGIADWGHKEGWGIGDQGCKERENRGERILSINNVWVFSKKVWWQNEIIEDGCIDAILGGLRTQRKEKWQRDDDTIPNTEKQWKNEN